MTRNSFYILSICFAGVVMLKSNSAWSDTVNVGSEVSANVVSKTAEDIIPIEPLTAAAHCLTGAVAEAIQNNQLSLQRREVEIAKREKVLKALEARVQSDIELLENTNTTMKAELGKLQSIATGDLRHLVAMYETMKPKKAAEIFSKMDPKFAAGFIRQIKPNTAGLILAEMDSTASYKVSLIIANQNLKWREP